MRHEVRFTLQKIEKRLALIEPLVYRESAPMGSFRFTALQGPLDEPPVAVDIDDSSWEVIEPETYWASWLVDFTLRTSFTVPSGWKDEEVALYLPIGDSGDFSHPETLAYIDGEAYAACDRHHNEIMLPKKWCDGRSHVLALHGWTGLGGEFRPVSEKTRLFMRPCSVVVIDRTLRDFIALARVAVGTVKTLDSNNPVRAKLLNALDDAFTVLDTREPFDPGLYESAVEACRCLRDGVECAGSPLDASVTATGHSHIDVAWLWTLGQTRRKVGRTFHTALRLMEQFPDYHFTQSQPQLYDYMLTDYPGLFEAVKERIREGRWEVIGGMWVEADCNISGAESLARQFLLGRTFFRRHFGRDAESPVLWLPDVFGYSWSIPQLIKLAGLEYFFTIKIGWNQYNRLPYDSFWWQGIDGTRVVTHFSTTPETSELPAGISTYNAKATPYQAKGTWDTFQQKEIGQDLLMAFGWGDGGGGPTREMLENLREMKSFPGLPKMQQRHVGAFFRELEERYGGELPVWNGELYFELHRGTYTSQARNKRMNRKCEFALHDAEFTASLASLFDASYEYPKACIDKCWELVCLNQFHDIIPGSSVNPVYAESQMQYAEVLSNADTVKWDTVERIAGHVGGDIVIVNPTSFTLRRPVFHKGDGPYCTVLKRHDGSDAIVQRTADGCLIDAGMLPPYSVTPFMVGKGECTLETGMLCGERFLENQYLRVELNDDGDIVRVYDKKQDREVIPSGAAANQFQAFEDRPLEWDAWDVFIYYDDKIWLAEPATSFELVEKGPLRATIEIKRRILSSEYTQRISISYNSPRIDFRTFIDWRERHVLLKSAFPVDILSPQATYEIQWGNVQRPTHRNTSWDWARFETCAQKWVDLSEGDYGVSLLNDCKYGHDIHDNIMRISLLRSPTNPDPEADQGRHEFTYSMYLHDGVWNENTLREAYALNDPAIVVIGSVFDGRGDDETPSVFSFIHADRPNIIIETVKRAEDGNGFIVRLYEAMRRRGTVTLTAGFSVGEAWKTNLLEENGEKLDVSGRTVSFDVRPFEIVNIRLVPERV